MTGEGPRRITVRKVAPKILLFASFLGIALFESSCSLKRPTGGTGGGTGGGGTGGGGTGGGTSAGPFTIPASVVGLTGGAVILEDYGGDVLTIADDGDFTVVTLIACGGT